MFTLVIVCIELSIPNKSEGPVECLHTITYQKARYDCVVQRSCTSGDVDMHVHTRPCEEIVHTSATQVPTIEKSIENEIKVSIKNSICCTHMTVSVYVS